MSSCKRSVLAVAMLVVISMPVGLFLYWKVQQLMVRHEMMEKLEHEQLQTIEIPASSVKWYEEDKEIIVDGRMFDVKSYKPIPGTHYISFTGLYDDEESEIAQKVKKLTQQNEKNNAENRQLMQVLWLLSCPLQESDDLAYLHFTSGKSFRLYITGGIPVADLATPAPPPKV